MEVMGIAIEGTKLAAWIGIELVVGFLIGFIIIPIAFRWAVISVIVIGALAYFGFVSVNLDGLKDAVKGSGIKSLLIFISAPLIVGIIIGWVVKKIF